MDRCESLWTLRHKKHHLPASKNGNSELGGWFLKLSIAQESFHGKEYSESGN